MKIYVERPAVCVPNHTIAPRTSQIIPSSSVRTTWRVVTNLREIYNSLIHESFKGVASNLIKEDGKKREGKAVHSVHRLHHARKRCSRTSRLHVDYVFLRL